MYSSVNSLQKEEIKILIKNIHSLDTFLFLEGKPYYMDDIRWEKMQRLRMEKDKLRSLASGYLLNKMCKELAIPEVEYGYEKNGKPYIQGQKQLAFNLSHSGDYAVLAYSGECQALEMDDIGKALGASSLTQSIGIDIQQIRPMREGMKKRILHEKEQVPSGLSLEEETLYLNRIWSIKESYVKMTGDGLSLDFRNIYIDFEEGCVKAEQRPIAFFMEDNSLPGYTMAVCFSQQFRVEINECQGYRK